MILINDIFPFVNEIIFDRLERCFCRDAPKLFLADYVNKKPPVSISAVGIRGICSLKEQKPSAIA
jgi:hypothetical protein